MKAMRSVKFFTFLFSVILFTTVCNGWKPWSSSSSRANDMFCFVIRTYWGHGGKDNPAGLRGLLKSIQQQQAQRWEAVLIVADSRPFPDLQQIVMEHNDTRIWVFAEWIGNEFAPKTSQGAWVPGYHEMLYNLTDDAIQVCPPDTKWLVVTNGDNEYGASFTTQVTDITTSKSSKSSSSSKSPDIVAFDFYSRYQRPTAPPCDRFHAWPGAPSCKPNKQRWCQTDLGANAISFPKFMQESRMFGSLHEEAGGLGADHFDGILAETLVAAGWKVARVTSKCLFSHSPNPQECAWSGGVWDDSDVQGTGGGRCIDWGEREKMLTADRQLYNNGEGQLEEVIVTVSSDGNITSEFQSSNSNGNNNKSWDGQLRCLRKKMYNSDAERNAQRAWFSSRCADEETGDLQEQTQWEAEVWPLYSTGQLPYQQQQAAVIGDGGSDDQYHHHQQQQQEQQWGEVEVAQQQQHQQQQQQEAQIGDTKESEQQQQHTQSVHHHNVPPTVVGIATTPSSSQQKQQQLDRDPTVVPESWSTLQAEFRSILVGHDGVPVVQRRAQYVINTNNNNVVGEVREPFTTPPTKTV